jgi:hypothetical protein
MFRFIFFVFGITIASTVAVEAMPFHRARTELIVPVAAGCGLGVPRALYVGCYPIYPPGSGAYYNPYYVGYYSPYYYDAFFAGYYNPYFLGSYARGRPRYLYRRPYSH